MYSSNNDNPYQSQYQQSQQYASSFGEQMTMNEYLGKTFRWMAAGLGLTFVLAFVTATSYEMLSLISTLYLPLTIAELALVFVLSARIQKIQVGTARALFLGYAALNGLVMSFYFVVFDLGTLILAFLSAALFFGMLAVYGLVTKRDLSPWGPKLMIGLISLLVCSIIGMFTGFGFMASLLYSGVGLVIFMLLTAYDTQKLYQYYNHYSGQGEMMEKTAVYGALSLYLDFINIFIMLLRLFGGRSKD